MPAFETTARRLWLTRLTGAAALLLIGVTWPLWLPPTPTSFPQLPLFGWLIPAPAWCDWAALGGTLIGAAGMLVSREPEAQARRGAARPRLRFGLTRATTFAPVLFTASLAFALALNQIRIQVWAYQFLLLGGVLSLCPRTETGDRAAVALARVLAVGILFHSGLSKLDLAFAEGPGRWLMGGFLGLFGVEADGLDENAVSAVAFAVPAWEIALSVLLAVPSLRRVGLIAAVLMHTSVVATLWNLDQSWGVLLWNAFFLAHEFVLFWPERRTEGVPLLNTVRAAGWRTWPAAVLIAAAVLLPFGTRSGYWDVWPGWAVYAGGVPRAAVGVRENDIPSPKPNGQLNDLEDWPESFSDLSSLIDASQVEQPEADTLKEYARPLAIVKRGGQMVVNERYYEAEMLKELYAPLPQGGRAAVGVLLAESIRRTATGTIWHDGTVDLKPAGSRLWKRDDHWNADPVWSVDVRDGEIEPDEEPLPFLLNARPRALSLPPEAR